MDEPVSLPQDLTQRVRRALNRISDRGRPDEAAAIAESLYRGVYEGEPEVGSAAAAVPLIAEHTRYFDGFGVLMQLPGGIGVAARRGGEDVRVVASGDHADEIQQLIERLYGELDETPSAAGVEVAAVCASPAGGAEAVLGAAGVALLDALGVQLSPEDISTFVTAGMEAVLGRPCGPAQTLASLSDAPITGIDAGSYEHVAIERPGSLGAAIIEVSPERVPGLEVYREHATILEASLAQLRRSGYPNLGSLRRLEHHEIPAALSIIDVQARPLLRHLVTEDRRVQRLLVAIRREDVQVLGALLLMSHASRRDDLRASTEEVEFVLGEAEAAEGVYGARMAGPGYGGRVLLVGRPFLLPDIVDRIAVRFEERFGEAPRTTLF